MRLMLHGGAQMPEPVSAAVHGPCFSCLSGPPRPRLAWVLMSWALLKGRIFAGRWTYDVMVMGNGALAGLVAITAGCSVIYPWGAILVGGFAGVLYNIASIVSLKLHVRAGPLL